VDLGRPPDLSAPRSEVWDIFQLGLTIRCGHIFLPGRSAPFTDKATLNLRQVLMHPRLFRVSEREPSPTDGQIQAVLRAWN